MGQSPAPFRIGVVFHLVRILWGKGFGYGIVDDDAADAEDRAGGGEMQPPKIQGTIVAALWYF